MFMEIEVAPNRFKRIVGVLLMALVVCSVAAIAQQQPASAPPASSAAAYDDVSQAPKFEFFGGYSWLNPGGHYDTAAAPGLGFKMPSLDRGFGLSATRNMGNVFGVTIDYSGHWKDSNNVQTFMIGPQVKWRAEHFQPFAHVLVGANYLSPNNADGQWQAAVAGGGGFDLLLNPHWGLRVFQADYIYTNWSRITDNGYAPRWNMVRLQGGVIYNWGLGAPPVPPSLACTAQPSAMMAGEQVHATATPSNFNPKRTVSYSWTSTGGKVGGNDASTTIDTTGLAPGTYTVKATATDNRKKNPEVAECSATFTINEPPKHPPTISCAANPTTVRAGDPINVAATGNSPDGRPLNYTFTTSNGKLSPNGANATLDTTGLPAGSVTVTCNVADDRGLTASTTTNANVEVPPPPPTASKLNEITFPNDKKPARVDNTAKAILDDVALRLQREPDSKAVVVGYATSAETKKRINKNLAAQRAINTKACLDGAEVSCENQGKQIDPSRIEVRTGAGDENKAEIWIVPSGANFTGEGTTTVDESKLKAQARTAASAPHKKATKKAAQ